MSATIMTQISMTPVIVFDGPFGLSPWFSINASSCGWNRDEPAGLRSLGNVALSPCRSSSEHEVIVAALCPRAKKQTNLPADGSFG
jgi:hypothetical protein